MSSFRVTEGALRQALCSGGITPVLQPVVRAPDGTPEGVEVLARWHLDDGTAVPPDAFIALATRCGLEAEIARILMEKVTPSVRRLARGINHPLVVGFNAGPVCLTDPVFEEACKTFNTACNDPSVILAVEVTEREPLMPSLVPTLKRLRKLGVRIVLDDFGTGYATVEVLPWLSPDVVKLDRSLTMLAGKGDPDGRLASVLETLRQPGIAVLAEGVEIYREYKWLYNSGIRLFQGYLFCRPMPPKDFERGLRSDLFIPALKTNIPS